MSARRFAVSMQLFDCNTCSCCGLTRPFHDNPEFPKLDDCPFKPRHLNAKYYKAWKCNCETCNGKKYYAAKRPSVMKRYKNTHDNKDPWEVMDDEQMDQPNALLCNNCYQEQSPGNYNENSTYKLCLCMFCIGGKGSNIFMYNYLH